MEPTPSELNPYAPPAADLSTAAELAADRRFYVVSPGKFAVLFFATLGMYSVYWFYANWKAYREASGQRLWPIPRAIFNIFFTHSLMRRIQQRLDARNIAHSWSPGAVATGWVILSIVSHIADQLSYNESGYLVADVLSFLILIPLFLVLRSAQVAINTCEGDPQGACNANYTGANWLWILIGLLLWLLAAFGYAVLFGLVQVP